MPAPPSVELCSWKEIASYLGVSVKTAQNYERNRGLPILRVPGQRAMVRATTAALNDWKDRRTSQTASESNRQWLWNRPAAAVGLLLILAGVVALFVVRRRVAASLRVEQDALVGLDDRGGTVWRAVFGALEPEAYAYGDRTPWLGDLDKDGSPEVLFAPFPSGPLSTPVPLVCLDGRGRERWRFTPGRAVRTPTEEFANIYAVRRYAVLANGNIVVTSHHYLYYPSQVAVLSPDGRLLREYWHSGHLNALATATHAGHERIYLGGVNTGEHRATLVVLDPEAFSGAASTTPDVMLQGFSPPVEVARFLFPVTCRTPQGSYNSVAHVFANPESFVVDVWERVTTPHPPSMQYTFGHDLAFRSLGVSDGFLAEHAAESEHKWSSTERDRLAPIIVNKP